MNLPKIHHRELVTQQADGQFGMRVYGEIFKSASLTYDQGINIFCHCIINLSLDDNKKTYINECHRRVENVLRELEKEYALTYGEVVKMLSSKLQGDAKYVIRWERHGSFDKEGGWEDTSDNTDVG